MSALLAVLFAVEGLPLLAQQQARPQAMPVSIHGEVRYAQGGKQAENVLVVLESFAGGMVAQARTDRAGKFDFSNIDQAIYRVTASTEGFQPATQEINLMTTYNEYVVLTLAPKKSSAADRLGPGMEMSIDAKVPEEARTEFEKGRSELLDSPEKGISDLEKAVKIYPNFLQARLLLGTAYMDSHQADKAESCLKRVLEIDPKTAPALFALGEIYREKKKYPEAEKSLQQGLQINDSSWQGHLALGRLYWETGNVPKAGAEVGRTLQLKPDAADAYLLGGNVFLKARKAPEALQMFSQYLVLAPKGQYAEQTRVTVEKIKKALERN
ncbi:MAG TPA: tetratricopeptide repeat protein [Acidobacteriota bacterium]|nr:tetratricopeptide repeat protein [Acidobacteriota bacterium]